jgi:pilus assembly protein CpaE
MGEQLEHNNIAIAVVDIDPNPENILKELDKVAPLYPKTRFAVVSTRSSKELILDAMHSGARYFMLKKFIEAELDRVLEKILMESSRTVKDLGALITVFSAGGGCGATTVAINVANELRLRTEKPVLMVDMDDYYGAVSNYLGINGQYGMAEVLQHEGPIDINLIATSAASYKDDFHVLVPRPYLGKINFNTVEKKHLKEALEACRRGYKYTVIDAPRGSMELVKTLAAQSRMILVVFQTTVKDVKTLKLLIGELVSSGIKREKILPVANRFHSRGPIVPFEEIKKTLGIETLYHIRNDFKQVARSINYAKPLSDCAPKSKIRRDFQKLTEKLYLYQGNGDT